MTNGTAGVSRREVAGFLLATGLSLLDASCANAVATRPYQIGPFVTSGAAVVPPGIQDVQTSGYHRSGIGAAVYVYDAMVNAAYLSRFPRSAFRSSDGRGFRLQAQLPCNPETFGLRVGLNLGFARENQEAISEALVLCRKIALPAGDIDFTADGGFVLPALDGLELAGQGWTTRLVSQGAAFTLPTLSDLTIRDLWIEQTGTAGATIQSLHCNLRDIRFLRLKITMRDQATCQNNCIGLVMDASRPGKDGLVGLRGLLIEDCWLAPGRMGVEIQNHRDLTRLYGYRDVTMRGCTVWKAPAFAGMGISLSGWGTDCLVENNRFVGCHGPSVEIIGGDRTSVINNRFEDAIGPPVAASNFRVARNCRIANNRTTNSPAMSGLFLEAVDGLDVSGNRFDAKGVHILKGSRIHLHNNALVGSGTVGMIQLDHAQGALIENNSFRSVGRAEPLPMIAAFNATKDCVIRFNTFTRADYDIRQDDRWVAQGPEVRRLTVHGNERCSKSGCFKEPSSAPRGTA